MPPSGTFSVQMLKTRLSSPSRPEIVLQNAISHLDSFFHLCFITGISACQRVSLESPASAQLGSIPAGVLGSAGRCRLPFPCTATLEQPVLVCKDSSLGIPDYPP